MDYLTILGVVAGILTTSSFIPQIIKIIKTRSAKDVSLVMFIIISFGISLWLIYGILKNDFPIMIANAVTLVFNLTILFLKYKYR
jgi:MtN3 and saliva related transmembrane protein